MAEQQDGIELHYQGANYGAPVPFRSPKGNTYEVAGGGTITVQDPEDAEWLKQRGFAETYTPVLMEYSGPSIGNVRVSEINGNQLQQSYMVGSNLQSRYFEAHPDDATEMEAAGLAKRVQQEQQQGATGDTGSTPTATVPTVDPNATTETSVLWLTERGIREEQAQALYDAGFTAPEAIRSASNEQLRAVEGIGPATLEKLRTL